MIRVRRSSQSGFAGLISIIGLILIVLTIVGSLMSMQPLEVLGMKQLRVQKDLTFLADAMTHYAQDVIRANYYDSTGTAHYRMQYCIPNLGALLKAPNTGTGIPDTKFWHGPYVSDDKNPSFQLGMAFDPTTAEPLDPWGLAYGVSGLDDSVFQSNFTITCVSREAGSTPPSIVVDMYPLFVAVTKEREEIVNLALARFNTDNKGTICTAWGNALPSSLSPPTTSATLDQCANAKAIFNILQPAGYLPNNAIYYSDAWGKELLGYSSLSKGVTDPTGAIIGAVPLVGSTTSSIGQITCIRAGKTYYRLVPLGVHSSMIPSKDSSNPHYVANTDPTYWSYEDMPSWAIE